MDEHQDETPHGTTPPASATPPTEQPTASTNQPTSQPFDQPFGQPLTPPPAQPRHRRGARIAVAGTLVLAVGLGGGIAIGHSIGDHSVTGSGTPAAGSAPAGQLGWGDQYGNGTGQGSSGFGDGSGGFGDGGSGSSSGTGTGTSREATDAESVGVVDITTVIDYGQAQAAGTGVVLTANGEILTNNHVVNGATKITVTVVSTGQSYAANVVGTDATDDVAVLQLSGASGLNTAKLSSDDVSVGDAVTAVGNAGGTGGTPTAATGTVTAVNQSITASDEGGSDPEQLTGMIQVDADIQAGDSGGPLYDSDGEVVGIDTAASSGQSDSTVGFAIPIDKATSIADRIESGEDSATIQQGTPAFLGVQLAQDTAGAATISGVVDGSPAADAGLQAGDTITAVGGTTVDSADALSAALAKQNAGDQVRVTWVDSTGTSHTATITLVAGPAA
ncbi:MAG TPA: trypsin-like peptidase domain-containing protein [Mycobacteriales bacterium]|nr:trypsin-like peptidase domain-containing protein [Mycobacteriales bacterium]